MGRKLDRTAASNPDFLRRGNTWAVLNAGGKQHSLKDRLAIWARTGAKTPVDWWRSDDGNRSSGDDLIRVNGRSQNLEHFVSCHWWKFFVIWRCLRHVVWLTCPSASVVFQACSTTNLRSSRRNLCSPKMRNCAVQKHKVEDIIEQFCGVLTLQNTCKDAILRLSSKVHTLKCCQLQGASPPDSLTRGSALGRAGGFAPTPRKQPS